MQVLGHSRIKLALGTYSHVMPEVAEEAAERMQMRFGADWHTPGTYRLPRGGGLVRFRRQQVLPRLDSNQ
jgi:hypothetical protein